MVKLAIVLLVLLAALVIIDIFCVIKCRNEQVRTGIEIAEAKASVNKANERIDELKGRALNEQDISTEYVEEISCLIYILQLEQLLTTY